MARIERLSLSLSRTTYNYDVVWYASSELDMVGERSLVAL
jgi:hypothetical protein